MTTKYPYIADTTFLTPEMHTGLGHFSQAANFWFSLVIIFGFLEVSCISKIKIKESFVWGGHVGRPGRPIQNYNFGNTEIF